MKIIRALILVILGLSAITAKTSAQSSDPETIFKDWYLLEESPSLIDVSARIVKCSDVAEVHLTIFNENVMTQTANFDIEIKNATSGAVVNKNFSYTIANATIHKAECGDATYDALKIAIPASYDPESVEITIKFN